MKDKTAGYLVSIFKPDAVTFCHFIWQNWMEIVQKTDNIPHCLEQVQVQ